MAGQNSFYRHYKPEPTVKYKFTFTGSLINSVGCAISDFGNSISKTAKKHHMVAERIAERA